MLFATIFNLLKLGWTWKTIDLHVETKTAPYVILRVQNSRKLCQEKINLKLEVTILPLNVILKGKIKVFRSLGRI